MNTVKTAIDYAKDIRAALKAKGITSRQVSIKAGYCGYDDYIHATIKTGTVDIREVEKIVEAFQYIDRDERTGEILAGGNTYTRTKYSDDAFDNIVDLKRAEDIMADAAFNHTIAVTNNIYIICEGDKFIARDRRTYSRKTTLYTAYDVAKVLYTIEHYDHI